MDKYLLIGKCRTIKHPEIAGGVIVLFEQLLNDFKESDLAYRVIDLNNRNYFIKFFAVISIYVKLLFFIPRMDVIFFNGTAGEYKFYSWYVVLISKVFGKKIILRKFAGNFHEFYEEKFNFLSKVLVGYALKNADINYFETKYLISNFALIANNPKWFPNIRKRPLQVHFKRYRKKFIFIGHVSEVKGITEILKAKQSLGPDFTIDVFGPKNYNCPDNLKDDFKRAYKGVLSSKKVIKTLQKYDVLVLPTYHTGEGYPGVILEAFSVGIPVIATPLEGIREMIKENESGIFVEQRNYMDLIKKIESINDDNYNSLSEGALKAFENFDSGIVMKRIFNEIENIE